MIVQDGWKLAAERQDDGLATTLMTHLDDDPYELTNRVEDATCADRRQAMLDRLAAWDRDVRGLNG
jgi:arylsulfatase A-like enzyme